MEVVSGSPNSIELHQLNSAMQKLNSVMEDRAIQKVNHAYQNGGDHSNGRSPVASILVNGFGKPPLPHKVPAATSPEVPAASSPEVGVARAGIIKEHKEEEEEEEDEEEEEEETEWVFREDKVRGYGVDERDLGTADSWLKRHPELVRLTGRHPFNCEPPLSRLMDAGFITPVSLHYVRNHGYVPRVLDGDGWTVEVSGNVARPGIFTLQQLKEEFRPRALPVTLVCAGNRRKEQNMVKQSIGFSWGAAAVSTSVWKGVRLCDLLKRVGVKSKRHGALFVCFEGAEKLPGGGGTKYGTSLKIDVAMDEANDILLAYEQNGKELEPDHGFPIRMIIPGYIGGRMVKWLTKIWVTSEESNNFYHYKDNRVLPSHVDAEKANDEGWWYQPDYIINELNINSTITTPAHAEVLPINLTTVQRPYIFRGYAYTGGGRKVIRAEVSLDGGVEWRLAKITQPEKPTKYGKYWCWCFWELEVEVTELLSAKELVVRAWDSAQNTQPQNLTWNVMGMMNNCWFRVKVHPCKPKGGGIGLTFEHPTRPGNQSGGWMVKEKEEEKAETDKKPRKALTKSVSSPFLTEHKRQITVSELRKHATDDSAWIVVHNKVYDTTKFLEDHPGGKDSIMINAGSDCSEEFDAIHSTKAKNMLEEYYIGDLTVNGSLSVDATPDNSVRGGTAFAHLKTIGELKPPVALNPREKISCRLIEKESISHDVRRFRFALPSPAHILGLPVGKHMFLSARINDKLVMRGYTPITSDDEAGYFDLVVKIYYKGVDPKFPNGGLMSQYLESLQIGDSVDVKGPLGHLHYQGQGSFTSNGKPHFARRINMLAGGTGITPMYQVMQAIFKDPLDHTEISLIYANRTVDDILLRAELEKWQQQHSPRLRIWYTVQTAPEGWSYDEGFMTERMFQQHLFPPGPDTVSFMCGAPPMLQFCCHPFLANLGHEKSASFVF